MLNDGTRLIPSRILTAIFGIFCIAMLLFTAISISAADEQPYSSESPDQGTRVGMYGTLTGQVMDGDTNKPISTVRMTLKYHELVRHDWTDSNGWYKFDNVPICFCLKNISAAKTGYESQYKLVAVHEVTYVNFSLNPIEDPQDESDEPNEPDDPKDPEDPKEPEEPDDPDDPDEPNEPEDPDDPDEAEEPEEPEEPDQPEEPQQPEEPDEPNESDEPDENHDEQMYGTITGIVIDSKTNVPIADALMTLKYHDIVRKQYTDAYGRYSFDKVPICFCLKNISASKDGYTEQSQEVPVNKVTYVNFTLDKLSDGKNQEKAGDDKNDSNQDTVQDKGQSQDLKVEPSKNTYVFAGIIGITLIFITIFSCVYWLNKKRN